MAYFSALTYLMRKLTIATALVILSLLTGSKADSTPVTAFPAAVSDTIPVTDTSKDSALFDTIFERVEIEATFPGGGEGWKAFLEANLNVDIPAKRKAPAGNYKVVLQFIVDKTGKVSDIKALTAHGFGMEGEVMRVMRRSPRWQPASMKGRLVKAYRKQPITFAVSR